MSSRIPSCEMELGLRAHNKHLMTAEIGKEFGAAFHLRPAGVSQPPLVLWQYQSKYFGSLLLICFISLEKLMAASF